MFRWLIVILVGLAAFFAPPAANARIPDGPLGGEPGIPPGSITVTFTRSKVSLPAWTVRRAGPTGDIYGVAYGAGTFVAAAGPNMLSSPDGMTWTAHGLPLPANLCQVVYGTGQFVAVGSSPYGDAVFTSHGGTDWTPVDWGAGGGLTTIAYGRGELVAAGPDALLTSPDGHNWTARHIPDGGLTHVVYGSGRFLAVDRARQLLESDNGVTWTRQPFHWNGSSGPFPGLDLAYGGGRFVAVAADGSVATSPDGVNWTLRGTLAGNGWSFAYGGGQFVAAGSGGRTALSAGGAGWTIENCGTAADWRGVAFGAGRFVAVGTDGTIATRPASALLPSPVTFTTGSDRYNSGGTWHTMDAAPFLKDGRTYLPVRYLGYAIGMSAANITWDPATGTASLCFDGHKVVFTQGSPTYTVDGTVCTMDGRPVVEGGRLNIPARYFAAAFGYAVTWNRNAAPLPDPPGINSGPGGVLVVVDTAIPEHLYVYRNASIILAAYCNTGVAAAATPTGLFHIYEKMPSDDMAGKEPDGKPYFDRGVPWVMYFCRGCAIHGFVRQRYGYPQSVGCVELPVPTARKVYSLVTVGTPVYIR